MAIVKGSQVLVILPPRVGFYTICLAIVSSPCGGYRDEVSYLEAFLLDSLNVQHCVDLSYLMLQHMTVCTETTRRVLP